MMVRSDEIKPGDVMRVCGMSATVVDVSIKGNHVKVVAVRNGDERIEYMQRDKIKSVMRKS